MLEVGLFLFLCSSLQFLVVDTAPDIFLENHVHFWHNLPLFFHSPKQTNILNWSIVTCCDDWDYLHSEFVRTLPDPFSGLEFHMQHFSLKSEQLQQDKHCLSRIVVLLLASLSSSATHTAQTYFSCLPQSLSGFQ